MRLKTAAQYQRIFRNPCQVVPSDLTLFALENQQDYPRLGLVLKKKWLKRAIDRNRVKRQAREAFRLRQDELKGFDIVIMANKKTAPLDKKALRTCLNQLFDQFIAQQKAAL